MNCPETDRLIDYQVDQVRSPEIEAHLESCSSCREDLRIVRRIHAEYQQEIEVPESLIQRVLAGLPEPDRSPEGQRLPRTQTLISGLLWSLTAMAAVVAVESVGTADVSQLLLFSFCVGAVSVILQIRAEGKTSTGTP